MTPAQEPTSTGLRRSNIAGREFACRSFNIRVTLVARTLGLEQS